MRYIFRKAVRGYEFKGAGKWMSVDKMEVETGINRNRIHKVRKASKSVEEFGEEIDLLLWKLDKGMCLNEIVHDIEGHRTTSTLLARRVNCTKSRASYRLRMVVEKGKSWKWLTKPVDKKRQAGATKKNLNQRLWKRGLKGLSKRKALEDIPTAGTWERENIKPSTIPVPGACRTAPRLPRTQTRLSPCG